ncbi:MAG: sensor histidine kinase, partial [Bacilli bacterium]|nr:sensor histidine kinase [Bacilli bacterium]
EMIIACLLLTKHPLNFRFKAYIAIPAGLLIAFSGAANDIFGLYFSNQWNEFIKIAVYFIAAATIFLGFLFAYKIKVPQLLLLLSVAYTFQHMAYQWGVIVLDTGLGALLKENMAVSAYNFVYNLILYAVKIGIYIASYFLIARFYIRYSKYILGTANVIVLGVLVFLIANVVNVYVSERLTTDYTMRGILAAALIIFCIMFDTLVVGGFRVIEHRQETTIIKATLNSKVRQQEMMENNINFINMKCHDLRKELRRLKEHKGELKDEDFLMLEESLNFYDSSIKTGNVNIDALIQDKLIYCNSVGIEFTALVDGDAFKDMASSDIYFLLVNIIDNAIEASEAFEEKEKRVISLTASKKHGVLLIEETNYYKGEVSINSDGSIKTTKENKKYHGYGTKSIAYIVKKYDGKMEYDIKDGIFKLKIAI